MHGKAHNLMAIFLFILNLVSSHSNVRISLTIVLTLIFHRSKMEDGHDPVTCAHTIMMLAFHSCGGQVFLL